MAEGNSLLAIPANTSVLKTDRFLLPLKKAWAVLAGRDLSRSSSSASHSKWNYCLHCIRSAVDVFVAFLKISKEVTLSLTFSNYSGVALPSYCSSLLPGQNLWTLPLVTICWDQKGHVFHCPCSSCWLLFKFSVVSSLPDGASPDSSVLPHSILTILEVLHGSLPSAEHWWLHSLFFYSFLHWSPFYLFFG